ncbi:MAG: sigma-54-dependent Fis family transcriptional regulator [Bacteroidia bacterium]|nr:sigma-54-dependent Fis family transcriptional regulator [Bacteroidia bacterium]
MNRSIWILDDDRAVLSALEMALNEVFDTVTTWSDPSVMLDALRKHQPDIALIDMNYTRGEVDGREGLDVLRRIANTAEALPVVVMTAFSDVELAVSAMKIGAVDFIHKPWSNERLKLTLINAMKLNVSEAELAQWKARETAETSSDFGKDLGMVGTSTQLEKVRNSIRKVANSDANVLILGENGTGKELAANAIHQLSTRNSKPFVKIDLGSIHKELFESELFGARKGAYTGISADKTGRMAMANKGSLFLDEIGNLSLDLQGKLLSSLQNREIIRLGDTQPQRIDVRLISATNMNLERLLDPDSFRQDLLYRINTVEVRMPALRERTSDIPLLLDHFKEVYENKYRKTGLSWSGECIDQAMAYHWPGNIRELQHAVERAVLMTEKRILQVSDLLPHRLDIRKDEPEGLNLAKTEKALVKEALIKSDGNISHAANELGITRSALYRRLKKYGL